MFASANTLVQILSIHASMSGKSNPYNNNMIESFFSTLRAELTDLERFATQQVHQQPYSSSLKSFKTSVPTFVAGLPHSTGL